MRTFGMLPDKLECPFGRRKRAWRAGLHLVDNAPHRPRGGIKAKHYD